MARLIMAGVAQAEAFDGNELMFTANTLTESSLTIGLSTEDIRGGDGAGLLGRYFHTSTFELTLTDALFNLNYIAASVGANVEAGGNVLFNEQFEVEATGLFPFTLSKTAVTLGGCGENKVYAWYRKAGEDKWTRADVDENNQITVSGNIGDKYCVKYFYNNINAEQITVNANYVPKTLHLVLKENLYAAGESNNSQTKVGYVIIDIPRFQLDGSQDLSMSMTGASTTSLRGSALISENCADCDGTGYYAKMTQVVEGANWTDDVKGIAVDGGVGVFGEALDMYAIFNNKMPKKISADMLTYAAGAGIGIRYKTGAGEFGAVSNSLVISGSAAADYTVQLVNVAASGSDPEPVATTVVAMSTAG